MTFEGHDDLIDSREVIEQLADWAERATAGVPSTDLDRLAEQFAAAFADYCEDWKYGEMIIADSYFEDYAQELAEECYDLKSLSGNPYLDDCITIDWAKWADLLKQDYTSAEVDGVTYWAR